MNRRQAVGLASLTLTPGILMAKQQSPDDSNLESVLSQDLWTDRDAYDACHYLMIPLHAAFRTKERENDQALFTDFMDRFTTAWQAGDFQVSNEINRIQFLLLVSRYLRFNPNNEQLTDILIQEHRRSFLETPYPHWSQGEFASVRDSIEWKLSTTEAERQFYLAIVDLDRFNMTLAADLHAILGSDSPDHVTEARDIGLKYLRESSVWGENGEWLLSSKFWDHPDNAYAGHLEATENMEPKSVPGLPSDTSHAHRLPAILEAFLPGGDEPEVRADIEAMRTGLGKQLVNHCLVAPDEDFRSIRLTNYLDGYNGLYRWNYATTGEGNGYRPYELSGTFLLGWWSLLGNEEIQSAYQLVEECYPLTVDEIAIYVGPNTTRERNPLFAWPEAFYPGGFMQTCVQSAVLL